MLRAGVSGWWFCRTAESVLVVLADNGVKFRHAGKRRRLDRALAAAKIGRLGNSEKRLPRETAEAAALLGTESGGGDGGERSGGG
jgi:hypothetical protein